jgi:ABC-type uncharacterized transport system involved in gliding motility auxiliary subunit
MTNQGTNLGLGLAVGAALFLGVNALTAPVLRAARIDLTEQKLYTLSNGTKALLGRLEEPITLRMYFSKGLVEENQMLIDYAERVEDMLRGYVAAAGDKIELSIIDPEPFSEDEDRAVGFGIQGAPINVAGDRFYFGLVGTNLLDQEEVIPVLDPSQEAQLEYQLTELVDRLANPKRPVVGVISSFPLAGGSQPGPFGQPQQTEPWPIMSVLERRFELETLDGATLTEIPSDVTTLLLIHPKGLSVDAQYAIDQWCLRGGKVVAFIDPFSEVDPARQGAQGAAAFDVQVASEVDELIKGWGIELRPGVSAGDRALALQVRDAKGMPVKFPPFFELGEAQLSRNDIVTQSSHKVRLLLPGVLEVRADKPEGVVIETLLETSETGGTIDTMRFLPVPDPVAINESFASGASKLALGVRISGTVRTAFADGAPKKAANPDDPEVIDNPGTPEVEGAEPSDEAKAPHLTESEAPFNAIVIADADMLDVQVWGQQSRDLFGNVGYIPVADNAHLLVSALENMTGSSDLISLRTRADYRRPFERKERLAELAQEKFRAKEERLEAELRATEAELAQLQKEKDPNQALFLSPEQEEKIAEFREKQHETRKELRKVKRELRADIDRLGTWLKVLNILAVPLLLLVTVGLSYLVSRNK